jgi:hypothetical protein
MQLNRKVAHHKTVAERRIRSTAIAPPRFAENKSILQAP